MDKAEYKIATEHIKKLISQGEYAEASHIADTIDWRRVKSVMMLCTVSDLYKVNRRYEDAKELLYMAYERNPESRTILYSLCDLSIKLEEFVAAIEYYKSFVEVAPRDTGRYVLQYRLYQAQDVSLEERIEVLEQLKREEYIEKWAYELAYLYHRIGFATKCVEECDELILWFGKGRYVYKAMELKMLHEPLTHSQQYIYERRFEHLEQAKDMTRVLPRIDSGESEMTDEGMVDVTDAPTVEIPQEYIEKELQEEVEEIQVKTLDVANAYNTMNLQKELADSLREILEVSHTESSVDAVLDDSGDSEYADTAEMEQDLAEKAAIQAAAALEVQQAEKESDAEEEADSQQKGLVVSEQAEEVQHSEPTIWAEPTDITLAAVNAAVAAGTIKVTDAQSADSMVQADAEPAGDVLVEKQITGQLSIEDVLAEWDNSEEEAVTDMTLSEDIEASEIAEDVIEEKLQADNEESEQEQDTIAQQTEPLDDKPREAAMDFKKYGQFIRSVDTEVQIMNVLDNAKMDAKYGNISVTGHDLGVCFELIKLLLSDLKKQGLTISGKTAKISAVNFNKKEPSEIISKVQGGILIIERASRLRKHTAEKIMECLGSDVSEVLIFLTDNKQGMNRFFDKNKAMHPFFNLRIDIKDYTSDELVEHAAKYALREEYSIDEMGLLALRTRIEEMISNDEALTLEDAEEIVNEAIDHVNAKNLRHFMDILLRKRYDEEDMIILREDDFF